MAEEETKAEHKSGDKLADRMSFQSVATDVTVEHNRLAMSAKIPHEHEPIELESLLTNNGKEQLA